MKTEDFTINVQKTSVINTLYYNEKGKAFGELPDNQTAALIVANGINHTYKIKAKRGGNLYDPRKKDLRYGLDKKDKTSNSTMFKYKTVTKECFNYYIDFLHGNHDSLLILAERSSKVS